MNRHEIEIVYKTDEIPHILVKNGEFKGVRFNYGKVWFPHEDQSVLAFEYNIIGDLDVTKESLEKFKQEIGDLLADLMQKQIEEESLIYTGGT